jgi:primosomal protein N' (replication factor Y)
MDGFWQDALPGLAPRAEEDAAAVAAHIVPVLVPLAIAQPYDYRADEPLTPGTFVTVPLGGVDRIGVVWTADAARDPVPAQKLKAVKERLDVPPLPESALQFAEWVSRYTLAPLGSVLAMFMTARTVFDAEEPRWGYQIGHADAVRMTETRKRVLEVAASAGVLSRKQIVAETGASGAVIEGLARAGALIRAELPRARFPRPNPDFAKAALSDAQTAAADALTGIMTAGGYAPVLLDGVTGAGKTEVYFEAVAQAIRAKTQALILLPEIALTNQFLARFESRFGCKPAEWHSGVSPKERGRVWRAVAEGEAAVVAGARSALLLPFADLGLIVVDEEHDQSFKQDERVSYQARDMAVARASLGRIPIVLSSATPSIETVVNAERGRYRRLVLPSRYSGRSLPEIALTDLKAEPPEKGFWLNAHVIEGVNAALAKGEQALLFLNRRGYAPLTLCRSCGYRFQCPQCTAYLVEHRQRGRLVCHHCGFALPLPNACPSCRREGFLTSCGPGIERVTEEVAARWPSHRMCVLSSDLVTTVTGLRQMLTDIAERAVDIVIGTQLVSKGHNFPHLSFVGVVDGDLSLATADPRAGERTFQLLSQVMGRAGRFHTSGHGVIQTHFPDHPVMRALASGDRDAFYRAEIAMREDAGYPPFGRLVALIVSSKDKREAQAYAQHVALKAPHVEGVAVLGPVEAPLAIIRGRARQRLLVKADRAVNVQAYIRAWLADVMKPKGDVKLQVDVDPYNFM